MPELSSPLPLSVWATAQQPAARQRAGRYLQASTAHWFRRRFERRARRAGLPPIRFHDLRHTHATLALQAGVHPKVISERLGHSTVAMTLDIYSHAIPALQQDAAATIADLVGGQAAAAGGLG